MGAEGDLRVERPPLAAAARREAEPVDPHHAERVLHARRRRRQALLGQAAALWGGAAKGIGPGLRGRSRYTHYT